MDTFNPEAFDRLKQAEKTHFWFSARRKHIYERIKCFVSPPAEILEVGCGTGNISRYLSLKGYNVTGYEYFPRALELAYENFTKVRGDALSLPFKNSCFDVVGLFDVIEHFEDETQVLREAFRVVNERGIIVVTVPARKELWSYIDERARHKRRYTKEMLKRILCDVRLSPLLLEYMFLSLYVPMKYERGKNKKVDNQFRINRTINVLLKGVLGIERRISKRISLPIGTSLIAVARKNYHT
jgi:ubiquinone/menaquinone biosynthesis C-methylase UbiE